GQALLQQRQRVWLEDDGSAAVADAAREGLYPLEIGLGVAGAARRVLAAVAVGHVVGDEQRQLPRALGRVHVVVDDDLDVRVPAAEPARLRLGRDLREQLSFARVLRAGSALGALRARVRLTIDSYPHEWVAALGGRRL